MNKNFKMQPVRGTRDIYGAEMVSFNQVVSAAAKAAKLNNYAELSLPIFEFSEIFHRTLGESSDVVSKETYTFVDRDKDSITLRPEFTAAVARSVISNGLTQSLPIKYFSHGPVFRHERPQKARYRQFNQINFENIGVAGVHSDVELISLATNFFHAIGLEDLTLELSSIGDATSRARFKDQLVDYLSKYESSLSHDSKVRLKQNPLRILDSKDAQDQQILEDAPKIYDSFSTEALNRFDMVKQGLSDVGINYQLNPKLVRGLDYYTDTVFEFTTDKLGAQSALLAGGRYDGLFELMGASSIPAIGFAAGIERIAALIDSDKLNVDADIKLVFLIPIGLNALNLCPKIAGIVRSQGINADFVYNNNVAKQMQRANKMQATHTVIFGDEEIASNLVRLKDMKSGDESTISIDEIGGLHRLIFKA